MPLQFYSPTKTKTGAALSVKFASKDQSIFFSLIQQTGWDDKTRKGSFRGGKMLNFKLSLDETAGLIQTIESRSKVSFYHTFGENSTTGSFNYYEIPSNEPNKDPRRGFGLTLKNGTDQFKVGFTMGSAQNLLEYLRFALTHCYSALYAADKKADDEYFKKKDAEKAKQPVNKPENSASENQDATPTDESGGADDDIF